MDCAEEVSLLRRQLAGIPGVKDLNFDIFQAKLSVQIDPRKVSVEQIEKAVSATGMKPEPWRDSASSSQSYWDRNYRRILAAISGVALAGGLIWTGLATGELLESILVHSHDKHHHVPGGAIVLFAIAVAASIFPAIPKAIATLRQLRPDMNALVVLSVVGAGVLGEWSEAATLSFLFAVAQLLESWSMANAREAISRLIRVAPPVATVIHEEGHCEHDLDIEHEHRVAVENVKVGSIVRVKPGERIPFDGEVVRGHSMVNQAMITGESMPQAKEPGDSVYAGSIAEHGRIDIRTSRVASDTVLARMIRMVEASQSRRAPSEQFVEKFARVYTPAVFLLAFVVAVIPPLLGWGTWNDWFYQGMVVLLISCPCALVISTPVSIVAALASAARQGVLIKGGTYLEEAAKLRAIAFDKTGVLTMGEPEVQKLIMLNGHSREALLERLSALEMSSEHPIARAILRYAQAEGIYAVPLSGFQSIQGTGAEAEVDGQRFWVGNTRMIKRKGLESENVVSALSQMADSEHTVVACGTDKEVWGLLGLADPPRPEAREAVTQLKQLGIVNQVMLTGDNRATAESVAKEVGVDRSQAEMLPEDKAREVGSLVQRYRHAAMIGDGVNDAQALARASVGIGFGKNGSDVAMETADVVLLSSDLRKVPFLIWHARRTVAIIQQNIAFALATKVFFLVMALTGNATLWMAVLADMGATFIVTFNGLRLLRAR